MKSKITFYDVIVEHSSGVVNMRELRNIDGKYCHKFDVEPVIRSYEKRLTEYAKQTKNALSEARDLRNSMDSGDAKICDHLIHRLESILKIK